MIFIWLLECKRERSDLKPQRHSTLDPGTGKEKTRKLSEVGFEPTPPGETATWTQRLRPLGHPDSQVYVCGIFFSALYGATRLGNYPNNFEVPGSSRSNHTAPRQPQSITTRVSKIYLKLVQSFYYLYVLNGNSSLNRKWKLVSLAINRK